MAVYRVTPAGAGDTDGSSWANAMGEAEFEVSIEGGGSQAIAAGDIYYVQAGTYTLDSSYDSSATNGTGILPISIIGVKAATVNETPTYTDWPTVGSEDRPTFVCGAYLITVGTYNKIFNCMFTGATSQFVITGTYTKVYNCKFYSTHDGSTGYCLSTGNSSDIMCCEFTGDANAYDHVYGYYNGAYCRVIYCYFHDINGGFIGNSGCSILFCVFDNLKASGIYNGTRPGTFAANNTFYNCLIAVNCSTGHGCWINNIVDSCTNGFKWTTQEDASFYLNNHGDDVRNTTMWTLVATTMPHMDPEVTSGDPQFSVPGSDFSLGPSSPCVATGMQIELAVGD